jgi:hypothetical protein
MQTNTSPNVIPPLDPADPNRQAETDAAIDKTSEQLKIDHDNAFMLYAIFVGDPIRTAHALNTKPELVVALASAHDWDKKLKPIIELHKGARAGDIERAINRAMNFVQARKCQMFFERVLTQLVGMSPSELEAFIFPRTEKGKDDGLIVQQRFTTRSLADMASALEKCHAMTYMALNDTATERTKRGDDEDSDATTASVHLQLAAAIQKSGGRLKEGLPLKVLKEDQQTMAQEHAAIELIEIPREVSRHPEGAA